MGSHVTHEPQLAQKLRTTVLPDSAVTENCLGVPEISASACGTWTKYPALVGVSVVDLHVSLETHGAPVNWRQSVQSEVCQRGFEVELRGFGTHGKSRPRLCRLPSDP